MKRSRRWAAVLATALAVAGWIGLRSEKPSAQESLKTEVKAALDEYVRAFSSNRADVIADRVYMAPSFTIGTGSGPGVVVSMTTADVKGRFESNLKALAEQNYQRSETKSANVCILNNAAAIVSAQFTRYRKDGTVLSEPAATYVFVKTAEGWRIAALMGHTPDRALKCGA
jgi:hypothetical protein